MNKPTKKQKFKATCKQVFNIKYTIMGFLAISLCQGIVHVMAYLIPSISNTLFFTGVLYFIAFIFVFQMVGIMWHQMFKDIFGWLTNIKTSYEYIQEWKEMN